MLWIGDPTYGSLKLRHSIADFAKQGDWDNLLRVLTTDRKDTEVLVNLTRPSSKALYSPLHQAAFNAAPVPVVQSLIDLGAWRTLRNADHERPLDVALRRGSSKLFEILTPIHETEVDLDELETIQFYFHAVIRGRADRLVNEHRLRLPELEPVLERRGSKFWFPVPGMTGGFSYWLDAQNFKRPTLVSESWCRVVHGSGERHEISSIGLALVDRGFV